MENKINTNETENMERKELATMGEVLEGVMDEPEMESLKWWRKIMQLVINNENCVVEELDAFTDDNVREILTWNCPNDDHIQLTWNKDNTVIGDDNGGTWEAENPQEAYETVIEYYKAVFEVEDENKEEEKETITYNIVDSSDLDNIDNEMVKDPAFKEFFNTIYFDVMGEKPSVGIGKDRFQAVWEMDENKIYIEFWREYDPEEYFVWTVSFEDKDGEHVLGEYNSPDEAIGKLRTFEKDYKKSNKKSSSKPSKSSTEKNEFGHKVGSIADQIDQMLMKGITVKEAEEAGIKPMRFHVHFSTMKRENDKVKCWKDGNKYFAAVEE